MFVFASRTAPPSVSLRDAPKTKTVAFWFDLDVGAHPPLSIVQEFWALARFALYRCCMDNAVALVQAYLQVNGYFTVVEYPIIESHPLGGFSARTDIDILAFRFPDAGQLITARKPQHGEFSHATDPLLQVNGKADMIIGEVKEGRAELNAGATDLAVLSSALARFGCCPLEHAQDTARKLVRDGKTETHAAHNVRLMAFGSTPPREPAGFGYISLGHIRAYLESYIQANWDVISTLHFKDSIFGLLVTLEKARRGAGAK